MSESSITSAGSKTPRPSALVTQSQYSYYSLGMPGASEGSLAMKPNEYHESKVIWAGIIMVIIVFLFFIVIWLFAWVYVQEPQDVHHDENNLFQGFFEDTNYGAMLRIRQAHQLHHRIKRTPRSGDNTLMTVGYRNGEFLGAEGCILGRWGPSCQFQTHTPDYYYVGDIQAETTTQELEGEYNLSYAGISRDPHSATMVCSTTSGCQGVVYNHHTQKASLITGPVWSRGFTRLELEKDPDQYQDMLYLKRTIKPRFTDRVSFFKGRRPLRYYLDQEQRDPVTLIHRKRPGTLAFKQKGIKILYPGRVYRLDWNPARVANYGGLIGVYSTQPFVREEVFTLKPNYLDTSKTEHSIPLEIYYSQLWVMYLTPQDWKAQTLPRIQLISSRQETEQETGQETQPETDIIGHDNRGVLDRLMSQISPSFRKRRQARLVSG